MADDELRRRAEGRIGTTLCGKYRVDSVLGVGGMAVVYAATHRNQKRVAVKMLHPELSLNADVRARFMREGYAANTVDHPGAVAVLDDDTAEDGSAFLVMERLEGAEVDELWQRHGGRLDVRAVLAIADGLLAVLAAAHAKEIVHRDIKPENLYVTRDGTLKVLDFGIARARDALSDGKGTKTGMLMGTPGYMAPEQALGRSSQIDGQTDVWAAGATLFALLSGQAVHDGETATAILVQAATQPARPLAAVAPDVDPRVAALVDHALAWDKATRWPSAAAMRAAVRDVHLAMFGALPAKEPLEQLVADPGSAATMMAPSIPPQAAAAMAGPSLGPTSAGQAGRGSFPDAPRQPSQPYGMPSQPYGTPSQPPYPVMGAGTPWTGSMTPPHSPAPGGDAQKRSSPLLPALIVGAAILGGAAFVGVVVSRQSSPSSTAVAKGDVPSASAAASTPPPRDDAPPVAAGSEGTDADASASGSPVAAGGDPTVAPAEAPAPVAPRPGAVVVVRPAAPAAAPTAPPTATVVAPAPTPTPTAPPAPPPMCRAQCSDVSRACKAQCTTTYTHFRDRHNCKVSCESTERDCKSRAGC